MQASNVEFVCRILFLLSFGFELRFELATDEMVLSAAVCIGQHSVKNVFQILLEHKHIVKKMPMFGPRMHQGCFQMIFLLDDCICHGKLALSAELEQEVSIFITATNVIPTKDSFPGHRVPPNSSIEVAKYQNLVICKSVVQMSVQI